MTITEHAEIDQFLMNYDHYLKTCPEYQNFLLRRLILVRTEAVAKQFHNCRSVNERMDFIQQHKNDDIFKDVRLGTQFFEELDLDILARFYRKEYHEILKIDGMSVKEIREYILKKYSIFYRDPIYSSHFPFYCIQKMMFDHRKDCKTERCKSIWSEKTYINNLKKRLHFLNHLSEGYPKYMFEDHFNRFYVYSWDPYSVLGGTSYQRWSILKNHLHMVEKFEKLEKRCIVGPY